MYHTVRKLFFTQCHCADGGGGSKTYEELFAKLDANKDGKVDVSELKAGLAAMGISSGKGAAQVGRVTGQQCHWLVQAWCAKSSGEEEEGERACIFPSTFTLPQKLKNPRV